MGKLRCTLSLNIFEWYCSYNMICRILADICFLPCTHHTLYCSLICNSRCHQSLLLLQCRCRCYCKTINCILSYQVICLDLLRQNYLMVNRFLLRLFLYQICLQTKALVCLQIWKLIDFLVLFPGL